MQDLLAGLRWTSLKLRKRLLHGVCRRLFRDQGEDLSKAVVLAGAARSGTTWLADMIASQRPHRLMFEPFHSGKVRRFAGFPCFPYRRPDDKDAALADFALSVLTGSIRDPWIDKHVDVLRPRYRLVKEIRANLFLAWLNRQFPEVPILFLVRHPCAVVSSRLRSEWTAEADLHDMLSQPRLVEDFLADKLEFIDEAQTPEEKHAIVWCIHNLVPLSAFQSGSLEVVFYEKLCLEPEAEMRRILELLQIVPRQKAVSETVKKPSVTVTRDSAILTGEDRVARWRHDLSPGQTERILEVVRTFGMDHLYGDSSTPMEGLVSSGGGSE